MAIYYDIFWWIYLLIKITDKIYSADRLKKIILLPDIFWHSLETKRVTTRPKGVSVY